jgi:hypothetical protein
MAELSELSLRALAVAQRAAGVKRCRGALKLGHGTVALGGLGEGSASECARQGGLDGGSDLLGGLGRGECAFGRTEAVPRVQSNGGGGALGPSGGEGKPHGRCCDLGGDAIDMPPELAGGPP